jgi:hypothetical protein
MLITTGPKVAITVGCVLLILVEDLVAVLGGSIDEVFSWHRRNAGRTSRK